MIEKRQAVEDLEQLLSVPGVDMVQFGATDCPPPRRLLSLPVPLPRRTLLTTALTATPRPADSVSIGQPGQDGRPGTTKHPKVEEAELKTIKTAQRMGIAMRIEADPNKILGPTVVRPNAAL